MSGNDDSDSELVRLNAESRAQSTLGQSPPRIPVYSVAQGSRYAASENPYWELKEPDRSRSPLDMRDMTSPEWVISADCPSPSSRDQ